jgi:hypothetical protein
LENEDTFAWDEVRVGDDDRSLVLSGVHDPPWASAPGTVWAFSRVHVKETPEAVSVRLDLVERAKGDPGALPANDARREVPVLLERPLGGRVVVDGCAHLVEPQPKPGSPPKADLWHRVRQAGPQTLVVYWAGGPFFPLDHVALEWTDDTLFVTVWRYGGGGRLSGQYQAAIVNLDQPLGDRRIADGASRK